MELLVAF